MTTVSLYSPKTHRRRNLADDAPALTACKITGIKLPPPRAVSSSPAGRRVHTSIAPRAQYYSRSTCTFLISSMRCVGTGVSTSRANSFTPTTIATFASTER